MSFISDPQRPIYRQIIEEIKKRTARGLYKPGNQLPSVRELARETGVNPNTVARAYMELERKGFIFTRRGQGTYITDDSVKIGKVAETLAQAAVETFLGEIHSLHLDENHKNTLLETIRRRLMNRESYDRESKNTIQD